MPPRTSQPSPWLDLGDVVLHCGDAAAVLQSLPAESASCCITSPPYWGLRDYGVEGQLGREPTPDEYLASMSRVFRGVQRVLRKDGTLWLNIGDGYAPRDYRGAAGSPFASLKRKDLVGMPWALAGALRGEGWHLRAEVIWSKSKCMPSSAKDRPTRSHEHLFLLSKSERYYYDQDAIREPLAASTVKRIEYPLHHRHPQGAGVAIPPVDTARMGERFANPLGRNARSVWTISPGSYRGAHFAVFPPELVRKCLLAGAPAGGVVLDPFIGSGTTAVVAREEGRRAVGIDLSEDFLRLASERLTPRAPA